MSGVSVKIYYPVFPGINFREIREAIIKETERQSIKLTKYIQDFYLSRKTVPVGNTFSTDPTGLVKRRGNFKRNTVPMPVRVGNKIITSGVQFLTPWAEVHVNEMGYSPPISAAAGKALAIPLAPARTKVLGAQKASPSDYPKGYLRMIRPTGGNPLLVRFTGKETFVPYFILKRSVRVPARVHPERILDKFEQQRIDGYNKAIDKVLNK